MRVYKYKSLLNLRKCPSFVYSHDYFKHIFEAQQPVVVRKMVQHWPAIIDKDCRGKYYVS